MLRFTKNDGVVKHFVNKSDFYLVQLGLCRLWQ